MTDTTTQPPADAPKEDRRHQPQERGRGAMEVRKENAAQKQLRALRLRQGGATYEQIAQQIPYSSREAAHKAVRRALDAIPREAAIETRDMMLAQLDELWFRNYVALQQGDMSRTKDLLKIMDRRGALTGAYTVPAGAGGAEDVRLALQGMIESARAFRDEELARQEREREMLDNPDAEVA